MCRLATRKLILHACRSFIASTNSVVDINHRQPSAAIVSSLFRQSKGTKGQTSSPFPIRFLSVMKNSVSAVGKQAISVDDVQHIELLHASDDAYGGVIVEIKEQMDYSVFDNLLRASISQWKRQGKKGVWIKLPIELVHLVEAAVKVGFWYHHAEPTYLMLAYWIPVTPHTLPVNASHRVGIGAFVMNNNGEVLVVQENNGLFKGTGVWKLPTGVVEEGEDICNAAIREVKEETGLVVEFLEVLAFRQSHKSFFGKSDLFFVCMLKPLSFHIQKQNTEIEAAQWMPIEEYATQPFVQKHELFNLVAKICLAKTENEYTGFSSRLATGGFSAKKSFLYFNNQDLKRD